MQQNGRNCTVLWMLLLCALTVLASKQDPVSHRTSISSTTHTRDSRPPKFVDWSKMKRAFNAWPASHSIRMRCRARGTKPLKYRWLKDGKEFQRRRQDPYMDTTLWYLRLKDLVPSDDGKYTCIVSNKYGSINHTYTLQVVAIPRTRPILQPNLPRNTTVQLGKNATMTCIVVVSGTLPDFRWLKWDKVPKTFPKLQLTVEKKNYDFTLVDHVHYKTIKAGEHFGVKLTIVNVTEEDLGLYTCCVSNHIGMDYVSAFLSKTVVPPTLNPRYVYPVSHRTSISSTTHKRGTEIEVNHVKLCDSSDVSSEPQIPLSTFIGTVAGIVFLLVGFILWFHYQHKKKEIIANPTLI